MSVIGWIVAAAALLIGGCIWSGYVLSVLWSWFVVTTFHAAPISIPAAIGMALIVRFMTYQTQSSDKDESAIEILFKGAAISFAFPLLSLGIGSIVKSYL